MAAPPSTNTVNVTDSDDTIESGLSNTLFYLRPTAHGDVFSLNFGTVNDTIDILSGASDDTINTGDGNTVVDVRGDGQVINAQGGNDTITLFAATHASVSGGAGSDSISGNGDYDTIDAGTGTTSITIGGSFGDIVGGSTGADTISVTGHDNTVSGAGATTLSLSIHGNNNTVSLSGGTDTVTVAGSGNRIEAGADKGVNESTVNFVSGSHNVLVDGPFVYNETVSGFNDTVGDRIHLTGLDTQNYVIGRQEGVADGNLLHLNDGSTILLLGASEIGPDIFI